MRQIAATSRSVAATSPACDKTLVLGTQANLEEGKCELVSKFYMADQRIQRRCNKKLMYADYAIVSLFLVRFLARSMALAWHQRAE